MLITLRGQRVKLPLNQVEAVVVSRHNTQITLLVETQKLLRISITGFFRKNSWKDDIMAANSNLVAQFLRFFAFFSLLRLLLLLACPCPGGIEISRITRHIGFVYNMCQGRKLRSILRESHFLRGKWEGNQSSSTEKKGRGDCELTANEGG